LKLGRIYDWKNESRIHGICVNKVHSGDMLAETPTFTASDPFAPTSHCWLLAPHSVTTGFATDIYGIGKRKACHSAGKSSRIPIDIDIILRRTAGACQLNPKIMLKTLQLRIEQRVQPIDLVR
jgi:hypothetical protein